MHSVVPIPNGALIATVDGLGHGSNAADAARRALEEVARWAKTESLCGILYRCDEALRETRGVVMSLAAVNTITGILTWVGVGNVEGRLVIKTDNNTYEQHSLFLHSGIVGAKLSRLQASVMRIDPGDMLFFATDGISPDFAESLYIGSRVEALSNFIMSKYCKQTDDALIVVARYLEVSSGSSG